VKKSAKPSSASSSGDDLPPPRKDRTTTTGEDDGGGSAPPPPKRSSSDAPKKKPVDDEDAPTERRGGKDDAAELRDEADHGAVKRSGRTAEEELSEAVEEDESLAAADEPGHAVAAELMLGAYFLHSPLPGVETRFTMGLNVSWGAGRYLFSPEWEFFHNNLFLEVSYLATKASVGTESVQVTSWYHTLSLAILFGYPLDPLLFYAKVGPSMTITPITYDVQGSLTSFSGLKGGVVYGVGVRTNYYVNDNIGIAGRIEIVRFRRGYLDDTMLAFGVGAAF